MASHIPVLIDEVINYLITDPSGIYIDGTFGRGGHARAVLQKLSAQGQLYAIDKDPEAINFAKAHEPFKEDPRFHIMHGTFADMLHLAQQEQLVGKVRGILLDLGVSSPQLDDAGRGFSFMRDGPLDMRMDPTKGLSAADWLARVSEEELAKVLKEYGDEKYAKKIARAVVHDRAIEPFTTTGQLSQLIARICPNYQNEKHPATRTFQAIRIYINQELEDLSLFLKQCLEILAPGGRLLIITFHSLEDRLVKRFMQHQESAGDLPAGVPLRADQLKIRLKRVAGAIRASEQECKMNPRSRSATLRVMEKLQ